MCDVFDAWSERNCLKKKTIATFNWDFWYQKKNVYAANITEKEGDRERGKVEEWNKKKALWNYYYSLSWECKWFELFTGSVDDKKKENKI